MKNVRPPLLKKGDKIGIISPARFVEPSEIEGGVKWLSTMGFKPVLGKHVYDRQDQFAGKDKDRASDLVEFLQDPDIKCIWATRGGYGCIRIIPFLKDINPAMDPKWFVGYSDLSVIHSWLNENFNIQSIHGPMMFSWNVLPETREAFDALYKVLTTGALEYSYNRHPLNKGSDIKGVLTGGNMSMLYSMRGTALDINPDGKILFIEDIDEYLYHIDRMMQNFIRTGWLDRTSGLLVGGMSGMNDNAVPFGKNAEEIIHSLSSEYSLPVFFEHPSGHIKRNMPLVLGSEVHIYQDGDRMICKQ